MFIRYKNGPENIMWPSDSEGHLNQNCTSREPRKSLHTRKKGFLILSCSLTLHLFFRTRIFCLISSTWMEPEAFSTFATISTGCMLHGRSQPHLLPNCSRALARSFVWVQDETDSSCANQLASLHASLQLQQQPRAQNLDTSVSQKEGTPCSLQRGLRQS